MIGTQPRITPALTSGELAASQFNHIMPAYARNTVHRVNLGKQADPAHSQPGACPQQQTPARRQAQTPAPVPQPLPQAAHTAPLPRMKQPDMYRVASRGQKTPMGLNAGCQDQVNICFGWNTRDARCDMDASAFLLNDTGRVPGDDWFVFYGHTQSPDGSVIFSPRGREDREIISLDFARLNPAIRKLTFVLTINEAIENHLHFGMIEDAYVRVLNARTNQELVSFKVSDYYSNVTSMTICEIYLHNGQWRFNPVGNGVGMDLAGQCRVYGVDIG